MATFLYRVGKGAFRRRWLVLLSWLVILGAVIGASATMATDTEPEFVMPGTESQEAFDLLEERFPESAAEGASARVVFVADEDSSVTDPEYSTAIQSVLGEISQSPQISTVSDPFAEEAVSPDEGMALAQLTYEVEPGEITDETREALTTAVDNADLAGLTIEIAGEVLLVEAGFGVAELVGLVVAAVVLSFTFGALIAAGLPVVTALIGVGIGLSGLAAASYFIDISQDTGTLATMLGLAVGIDYALFILMRYRHELSHRLSREEAMGRAVGTAGSAVFFAGLTVAIALIGLAVINLPYLTQMAIAAAVTVLLAVSIALTLLPALAGFAGKRIHSRKQRGRIESGYVREKPSLGRRWVSGVVKRPLMVSLVAIVGLGVVAIPVASLEMSLPDEGRLSAETTNRQAYDHIADGFGAGFNGPLLLIGDVDAGADPLRVGNEAGAELMDLDGVLTVSEPTPNEAGDTVLLNVIPEAGPSSSETTDLVEHLRAELEGFGGVEWSVSGHTAIDIDMSEALADALVPYLALIVGLSLILLLMVFRSLLVPLTAAFGFLLSLGAALGALVAVFQWGWAASFFGIDETGPIASIMPVLTIGIVFGLAMDYQIFLVTRMREAYVYGADPKQAIITGFSYSSRVVTAAALIMMSVFGAFVLSSENLIAMIGFGLAAAITFDAFVVRMTLIPALMALLGKGAWWLPAWLDRLVPRVDVEGEKLLQHLEAEEVNVQPERELVDSKS